MKGSLAATCISFIINFAVFGTWVAFMLNLGSDTDKRKYIIGFHISYSLMCKIFFVVEFLHFCWTSLKIIMYTYLCKNINENSFHLASGIKNNWFCISQNRNSVCYFSISRVFHAVRTHRLFIRWQENDGKDVWATEEWVLQINFIVLLKRNRVIFYFF